MVKVLITIGGEEFLVPEFAVEVLEQVERELEKLRSGEPIDCTPLFRALNLIETYRRGFPHRLWEFLDKITAELVRRSVCEI